MPLSLDLSAIKTKWCDSTDSVMLLDTSDSSSDAMALVNALTKKKSAPPWPEVLTGGQDKSLMTCRSVCVAKSNTKRPPSADPFQRSSPFVPVN